MGFSLSDLNPFGGGGGSTANVAAETKSDVGVDVVVNPDIDFNFDEPLIDNSIPPEMVQIEKEKLALNKSALQFEQEQATKETEVISTITNKVVILSFVALIIIFAKRKK